MALSTQFVKLKVAGTVYCIKDFPDIDPHGEADQIEITTLCNEFHEYIDGLKNYGDGLQFTMNYDESVFNTFTLKEYNSSSTYGVGDLIKHDGKAKKCNTASTTGTYDSTKWDDVEVNLLLCSGKDDVTGANGKFTISACDLSVALAGAGVGDALEMVLTIRPKSAIEFAVVS